MTNILYASHVSQISGAEVSLLGLLEKLDRSRYYPIVACPAGGMLPKKLHQLGIQTESLNFVRFKRTFNLFTLATYLFCYFCVLWKLCCLITKHRIQLIHSNSTNAHIYGAVAAKLMRVPSVWLVRDLVPLGLLGKFLFLFSSRIIAISREVAKEISRHGMDMSKLTVIYNGVDIQLFDAGNENNSIRKELGTGKDIFLVGMVSQMVPWKRHPDFLRALAKVIKKYPKIKALVVGDDIFKDQQKYKTDIANLSQGLGLEDKVIFTGYRYDIPEILADLDLLVVSSEREPFGRVIIESMASSKPVIATNAGGIPEIIQDGINGILVPVGDTDGISEAIVKIVRDRNLARRLGLAGRDTVKEKFTIEKNVQKVQDIYEELLQC